jgi:hypothetical protein
MLQLGSSFGGSGADFRSAAIFPYQETKLVVLFVLESYFIYAGADWSDLLSLLRVIELTISRGCWRRKKGILLPCWWRPSEWESWRWTWWTRWETINSWQRHFERRSLGAHVDVRNCSVDVSMREQAC